MNRSKVIYIISRHLIVSLSLLVFFCTLSLRVAFAALPNGEESLIKSGWESEAFKEIGDTDLLLWS